MPRSAELERQVADGEEADHVQHRVEHRQPELVPEQQQPDDRPEQARREDDGSHGGAAVEWEPEPRVERRQHEHERVGLKHGEPDRDDGRAS